MCINKDNNVITMYNNTYFECDNLMTPITNVFDSKGYKTQFSYEGHVMIMVDDNAIHVDVPFIEFAESVDSSDLTIDGKFDVDGWNLETDASKKLLVLRGVLPERVDNNFYAFYRILTKMCENLYNWACNLPYKNT